MFSNPNRNPGTQDSSKAGQASREPESSRFLNEALEALSEHQPGRAVSLVEKAIRAIDDSARASISARVTVRIHATHMLSLNGEAAEADRFLADAVQILATGNQDRDPDFHSLRAWRAELLAKTGRRQDAGEIADSVLEWCESHAPCSALEARALLVKSHLLASQVPAAAWGQVMSRIFSILPVVPVLERFDLSQALIAASAFEEAEGRFENARTFAREAIASFQLAPNAPLEAGFMMRAQESEMAHKIGDFVFARDKQLGLLKDVVAHANDKDPLALSIRISLAETHIELNEFEAAERQLQCSIDKAKEAEIYSVALQAADILSLLYISRDMQPEAQALRRSVDEIADQLSSFNQLLARADSSVAHKALGGDFEGALEELESLANEAAHLRGVERIFTEASLGATKAWVLSITQPDEAREALDAVIDSITALPPTLGEQLQVKVSMIESHLAVTSSDPSEACRRVQEQLDLLKRKEGNSHFTLRLALLTRLAMYQEQAGLNSDAVTTAREIVTIHESRNETTSARYAKALLILAQMLPEASGERDELIERALPILERRGISLEDL